MAPLPAISSPRLPCAAWLVRIPAVFAPFSAEIFAAAGFEKIRSLGAEFSLLKHGSESLAPHHEHSFFQWVQPVNHQWPCHPQKLDSFVEKAAKGLFEKFHDHWPQGVFVGSLQAGLPHDNFKSLASNLRGRLVQLFSAVTAQTPDQQQADGESLFAFVGKEGLYAGLVSPRVAGAFYPGGTRFINTQATGGISRAGAKVAEALHLLKLYRPPLAPEAHWLELGASPGGMTAELLSKGYRVTAIDRAPLDKRVMALKGLRFLQEDASLCALSRHERFQGLLCDMNGPANVSLRIVGRFLPHLEPGSPIIFTLKAHGEPTFTAYRAHLENVQKLAKELGLNLLGIKHLTYNRHEFTCFFAA